MVMISKLIMSPKERCTLDLWLVTTFSEGEVSVIIARQGTRTFNTRGSSKSLLQFRNICVCNRFLLSAACPRWRTVT